MIQWMLAIWSLVPLPFLNPDWTSGSSWFTYFWSLAWRILNITLLACSPGDLPNPGIKPRSPALQANSLPAEPQGKPNNAGVGSLSLLQGIFPTQGLNPGLPHCRQILYQLSHKGSPIIQEWVAYPFSRRSSQHRDWTQVSYIAGRFFTSWATREVPVAYSLNQKISFLDEAVEITIFLKSKWIMT